MKLTNTLTMKRKSGMTLLELTVVILVLLSLISILFIGARAWKKGSDRAGCILNQRNVQQAVRGHQNMHNLTVGDALANDVVFSNTVNAAYLKTPVCPGGGTYTPIAVVPAIGTLYITCTLSATDGHVPAAITEW